ncbi:hypothetical protein B0T17DRAFT_478912, partial [Bombardia bombarda]
PANESEDHKKKRIPRPRNSFIIYRQWMSGRIHDDIPGATAGEISVGLLWHKETPQVKDHFKELAAEEDRLHKLKYPDYRY